MNGELTTDARVTEAGEVVLEPEYLQYLREHGYPILEVTESHTVQRGKDKDSHLVLKIKTRDKPNDDPSLDFVADEIDLWVCDCADFRYRRSADVADEPPSSSDTCTHIRAVSKVEQAKNDENQATL